ncbi:GntR family transcriptional regulator [Kribbella sp. NPDC051936]|uniref:GntR family transcriptional regulator n=1 Tax=Kribbella sp. NPDC051936 TaxID=3154946 RepID=UPI0034460344
MPPRPASRGGATGVGLAKVIPLPSPADEDLEPYRRIAADLRGAIVSGFVAPVVPLPTMKELAERYGVALSPAHRAVSVLVEAGLVNASRGVRATVAYKPTTPVRSTPRAGELGLSSASRDDG